jgi:hypothetical protein
LGGRALDHAKCVTTAHPLDREPAAMFSNVVAGVKELEDGRDALCVARPLTSADGNLTRSHRRGPVGPRGTGIAQGLADAPPCPLLVVRRRVADDRLIFDKFISLL